MTFFCMNRRKFVFNCNWHYCNCNIWSSRIQRKESLFCACNFPEREARGKADKSMSSFFLTGNLTTRMTVLACFIVLSHNLAEYKCQIYIFYPASQKYLADPCSYIQFLLKEKLSTQVRNNINSMAVLA